MRGVNDLTSGLLISHGHMYIQRVIVVDSRRCNYLSVEMTNLRYSRIDL